jgi:hypothetical protein
MSLSDLLVLCLAPLEQAACAFFPQGGTTEEAHESPAESEVFHRIGQRCLKDNKNVDEKIHCIQLNKRLINSKKRC